MSTTAESPFPILSDFADLFDDDPQFARIVRRAEVLSHARGLPRWLKGNAVDLVLVLLAGQDLGLSTWEAINSFYPDDSEESGLGLHASAQRALLHRAGWGWRIVEATDERSTVALTDPDRPEHGELYCTYTIHDAQLAELTSGPNAGFWRRHPRRMLYAACTRQAVNAFATHVVRGTSRGWGAQLNADPAPLPAATPGSGRPHPVADRTPAQETIVVEDSDLVPAHGDEDPPPHTEPVAPSAPGLAMQLEAGGQPDVPSEHPAPAGPAPLPEAAFASGNPSARALEDRGVENRGDPGDAGQQPRDELTAGRADSEGTRVAAESAATEPGRAETGTPDDDEPRQAAWELLRAVAGPLKSNGVYQVLLRKEARIKKEKARGALTDDGEQLILDAQRTLGLSAHSIYRNLRKPHAPSASQPDHSPPAPLQLAPRPEMPDLCACEDVPTSGHGDGCPDGDQ